MHYNAVKRYQHNIIEVVTDVKEVRTRNLELPDLKILADDTSYNSFLNTSELIDPSSFTRKHFHRVMLDFRNLDSFKLKIYNQLISRSKGLKIKLEAYLKSL